jgi:DNA polymerase-1
MPTVALLDGHSLAYRAFYALPEDLATKSGQVTNAVYGFTSMVIKLLGDHAPDGMAVAWDSGRETFRTAEYGDYKAQRSAAPDVFKSQLPLIREVLDVMGTFQVELPGYEADDIIATLARRAVADGWKVLVVTGDRDSFQLVDGGIEVVYTRRGISDTVLATAAWVEEKYGVRPDQYVEYAALRGDNSDNLPGVPGVGEKTAARLIQDHASIEGIYEHLQDMTPRLRENLATNRDQVFLNRRLMRLVDDLDIEVDTATLVRAVPDREQMKELFDSLEFHSLWDRLTDLEGGVTARDVEVIEVEVTTATGAAGVEPLLGSGPLALDGVWDAGAFSGVVGAVGDERAVFIPEDRLDLLSPDLLGGRFVAADRSKELIIELSERGVELRPSLDPAIAEYVIDPTTRAYELEEIASRRLGAELVSADDEGGNGASGAGAQGVLDFGGGPDLDLAGRRAVAVHKLIDVLSAELDARGERRLFDEIEMPLVPVLARMQARGVRIDREYLVGLGESLRTEIAEIEAEIHDLAGGSFNVNSTLQLRKVLYEDLGLPILKKTSKGAPSTDASVLAKLEDAHPLVEKLLRYRELEKLRGTYVDGYLPLIADDGRIHAHFNQIAATTGRLSSDNPNMQNIPIRSETGRTIRKAFTTDPGWTFVVADYSQIELRVLAHLSRDPGLLEAFAGEGQDIHTATAARVFGFAPEDVTPEMRRRAKVINFGLLYGMEAYGLAERLEIPREEAQEHMDAYFEQFPLVRDFMQGVVADAKRDGFTTTMFGRRRYLSELTSDNFRIRQMGERMALNAPVQGSAADIIKIAMIELEKRLSGARGRLLLQIHDELVLEAPDEELDGTIAATVEVMEGVADLAVPLRVDVGTGRTLADTK